MRRKHIFEFVSRIDIYFVHGQRRREHVIIIIKITICIFPLLYLSILVFFLFVYFFFFLPTSTEYKCHAYIVHIYTNMLKKRKNQLMISIFKTKNIYYLCIKHSICIPFIYYALYLCWPSFTYVHMYVYKEARATRPACSSTHYVCALYRQFSHNMNAFIFMNVWQLCTLV